MKLVPDQVSIAGESQVHHNLTLAAKALHRRVILFTLCNRGSVAVAGALSFPVLLGFAGLAVEYGDSLVVRAETQRVADLTAYTAAAAYGQGSDIETMRHVALSVGALNGVSAEKMQVTLDDPSASDGVVRVTITTPRPIVLAQLISARYSVDVRVRAAAMLEPSAAACVQALAPGGTGITVSGGTSITAADCAISSNASVTASGSGRIVTETLTYDSDSAPSFSGGASLTAPDGGEAKIIRSATPDPLAGQAGVVQAVARLGVVAAMQAPVGPSLPTGQDILIGEDIVFGWNQNQTIQQASAAGCTASMSGNTWTFACPAGAAVRLGNLKIGGGLNLNFGLSGSADTTYSFSGAIENTGSTMRFGPGKYDIARGISTGGGTTTTFAAGTYRIGRRTTACAGSGFYSICNTSTLTFDGPSDFELASGVKSTGGTTLRLGTGASNSFWIGPSSTSDALTLEGSSKTTIGDATGAAGKFQIIGHVRTLGGSCLRLGAASNHDIAGKLELAGGVIFGSGLYAIDGFLHLGAFGGGSVICDGQSVSMHALDATFVLSGKGPAPVNANCNGAAAFCATAGYDSLRLVAPGSGVFAGLAVIGPPAANVTSGASFSGGASGGQISGAFYFPNGPITLSGGASAGGSAAGCLQLVGATIDMTGGTTAASECVSSGGGGVSRPRLIE